MRLSRRSFLVAVGALAGAATGAAVGRSLGMLGAAGPNPEAAGAVSRRTTSTTRAPSTSATPAPTAAAATSSTTTSTAPPPDATTTTPPATEPPATTTTAPPARAAALTIICKASWGARPLAGELANHVIDRLTVHHTAVALTSNTQAPARARQHQRFHQDAGWADLAYHYLVDANGHVYEGRPFDAPGDTFTNYDPAGHFLVCCEGHFDEQAVPEAQLEALAGMLAWGAQRFGVSPSTIGGHRDYASTTCPGASLYPAIADGSLQARVEALLAAGGVELLTVCDDEGDSLVAAIEAGTA